MKCDSLKHFFVLHPFLCFRVQSL